MKTTLLLFALALGGLARADEAPEKGGCKCSAAEHSPTTAAVLGGALALGVALRRRDRRR